jgi:hypothetical protein
MTTPPTKREAAAIRLRVAQRIAHGPTQVEVMTGKATAKPRASMPSAQAKVAETVAAGRRTARAAKKATPTADRAALDAARRRNPPRPKKATSSTG